MSAFFAARTVSYLASVLIGRRSGADRRRSLLSLVLSYNTLLHFKKIIDGIKVIMKFYFIA